MCNYIFVVIYVYRVDPAVYLINIQLTQTYKAYIELLHLFLKDEFYLNEKFSKKKQQYIHIIQTKLMINTKTPAIKYLNTNNVQAKICSPPPPPTNNR